VSAPTLTDVLAAVRRGNVAYIVTTCEQRRALSDPDGRIALDVLRHFLGARPPNPEKFPLTEGTAQAVARKLGYVIGQKHARALVRRLAAARVIVRAGQYRQAYRHSAARSGFNVALYKLGHRVATAASLKRKRLSARGRPSSRKPARRTMARQRVHGDPDNNIAALNPNRLSPQDVARFTELGTKTERLARGEPTEFIRGALYVAPEELSRIAGNLIDIAMRHIPEGEQAAFVREVETFASTVGTR
jgi:hypothetical protein